MGYPVKRGVLRVADRKKQKVFISNDDQYLFGQSTHYEIYKKLGAHLSCEDGVDGVFFAVWAPNAKTVHVVGTFNDWNEETHPLKKLGSGGIFAGFYPGHYSHASLRARFPVTNALRTTTSTLSSTSTPSVRAILW